MSLLQPSADNLVIFSAANYSNSIFGGCPLPTAVFRSRHCLDVIQIWTLRWPIQNRPASLNHSWMHVFMCVWGHWSCWKTYDLIYSFYSFLDTGLNIGIQIMMPCTPPRPPVPEATKQPHSLIKPFPIFDCRGGGLF
jgi:hypothetical protein